MDLRINCCESKLLNTFTKFVINWNINGYRFKQKLVLILVLQHSLLLILIVHVLHHPHVQHLLQTYQVCHVIAPSVHINDSILLADAVAVEDIEVLGCGIISWRPPPGNELEELGYVVRFFVGSTFATTTGYRRNQQYVGTDDIGTQSAIAEDLPYGTTVYAEVSVHVQCFMNIIIQTFSYLCRFVQGIV